MFTTPFLDLNDNWICEYFELRPDLYEFAKDVDVPALDSWRFDRLRVVDWAAFLRRSFFLAPTDSCVSYHLLIDTAPDGARIYINDRHVADYHAPGPDDPPFELNITDHVHLDTNEIGFRVACDAPGHFSGVRLQSLPCR